MNSFKISIKTLEIIDLRVESNSIIELILLPKCLKL